MKRVAAGDWSRYRDQTFREYFLRNKALYLMLVPGLLNLALFKYFPMWGIVIAFQQFHPALGILGSKWVGLKHFADFIRDPYFYRIISNTLILGVLSLAITFPPPIILALLLHELRANIFRRVVQTISYMPYFLSTVVVVGLLLDVVNPFNGPLSEIARVTGIKGLAALGRPEAFRFQYLISAVWQHVGFGSIIYLAAIAGVNPELYEAAVIDGAGRLAQVRHVTLPSILPTMTILFILAVGGILGNDFQKILLLYTPMNYKIADVISTYIYRVGLEAVGSNFSYATAVGLFSAVISVLFLVVTNSIAKSLSEYSLW